MSWCEQLTRRSSAPAWNGPAHVHNLLSDGDEAADRPPLQQLVAVKVCPCCERSKPATEEHFYSHTVRGKRYLHSKCKDCMRAEQAVRDRRRGRKG